MKNGKEQDVFEIIFKIVIEGNNLNKTGIIIPPSSIFHFSSKSPILPYKVLRF